ncbi:MAG: hypothetical protein AAGG75_08375 [Bacteroidota bacterium]
MEQFDKQKRLVEQTRELISKDFGLEIGQEPMTEEQLFELLADAVAYMIEHRLDFLLSLLYRLDVDEQKINFALSPLAKDPANIELARLIFARQKQRIFTKQYYKQSKLDDLEEGLEF